jgi:hypothetical protein
MIMIMMIMMIMLIMMMMTMMMMMMLMMMMLIMIMTMMMMMLRLMLKIKKGPPLQRSQSTSGCSITKYSSSHSFNPLMSSKSELNLSAKKVSPALQPYKCVRWYSFFQQTASRDSVRDEDRPIILCLILHAFSCRCHLKSLCCEDFLHFAFSPWSILHSSILLCAILYFFYCQYFLVDLQNYHFKVSIENNWKSCPYVAVCEVFRKKNDNMLS